MVRVLDYEIAACWMTNGRPYKRRIIVPHIQVENMDWRLLMSYILKVQYKAMDNGCKPRQIVWRVRRV